MQTGVQENPDLYTVAVTSDSFIVVGHMAQRATSFQVAEHGYLTDLMTPIPMTPTIYFGGIEFSGLLPKLSHLIPSNGSGYTVVWPPKLRSTCHHYSTYCLFVLVTKQGQGLTPFPDDPTGAEEGGLHTA